MLDILLNESQVGNAILHQLDLSLHNGMNPLVIALITGEVSRIVSLKSNHEFVHGDCFGLSENKKTVATTTANCNNSLASAS